MMRNVCCGLCLLVGCAAPTAELSQAAHAAPHTILDQHDGQQLIGVIRQQLEDADAPVVYDLFLARGRELTPLPFQAIDASIEEKTSSIAWLAANGELHLTPLSTKEDRVIAQDVFYGLIAQGGQIIYNLRVDGPESAIFSYDTQTQRSSLVEDGVGSDEALALSPDGSQVLLLSSRTGLSSLYRKNVKTNELIQMTNIGIKGGPGLAPSQVTPNPTNKNEVAWGRGGIAYRSQDGTFLLTLDHRVTRLASEVSLTEATQ